MRHQYTFSEDPIGCGLAGCLGGIILGVFGGGILLIIAAFTAAVVAPMPSLTASSQANPDLRVTVDESFLNRFADQPNEGTIRIDVLPGNQVQLIVNTSLLAFGVEAPVEITGLFKIHLVQQKLQVQLIETQVLGIPLPPELADFFSDDLIIINQDLSAMVDEVSGVLGTSVIISNVSTTETQVQLEIREVR